MPASSDQAQQTREKTEEGTTRSCKIGGVEEQVPVLRRRSSTLVTNSTASGPQIERVNGCGGDRNEDDGTHWGEWTKQVGCEPTQACVNSLLIMSSSVTKAGSADAQEDLSTEQERTNALRGTSEAPVAPLEAENVTPSRSGGAPPFQSGRAVRDMAEPPPPAQVSHSARAPATTPLEFIVSEELLMAPTPGHILEEVRDHKAEMKESESEELPPLSTQPTDEHSESQTHQQALMAGESTSKPLVGAPLCEGDTFLTQNFLPPALIDGLFEKLCEEVHFKKMRHQGSEVPRFVAVQGTIDPDGTQPVYRHPSDESPPLEVFTPAVQLIRRHVERALGHPVNHALIQCYRNGSDYISEHSDKTLDIFQSSYIANVSVGAMRTMVFRTKRGGKKDSGVADQGHSSERLATPLETFDESLTKPVDIPRVAQPAKRQTARCPMPHNSLIKMGLATNEKWLHGIKADKRPQSEKSKAELAWNGTRISLTFRYIATFLSPSPSSEPVIWGQGAVSRTREHARPVLNGQTPEAVALLRAFGRENNSPDFDWAAHYGCGYDVLHMKAAPRYFGCGDTVVDGRVRIMLAECGVKYARGDIGIDARHWRSLDRGVRGAEAGEILPVRLVMDDAERTTVVGDIAILLFLDAKHPRKRGSDHDVAGVYSRFYAAIALEQRWKSLWVSAPKSRRVFTRLKPHLMDLEKWAAEAARHTASELSIADYALWPALHDVALAWKSMARGRGVGHTLFGYLELRALDRYYREVGGRSSVTGVFGSDVVESVLPEQWLSEDDQSSEDEEAAVVGPDTDKGTGKG